jgi:hypothetical protein
MTTNYRVSLTFGKLPDDNLIQFATKVRADLYVQAAYADPPVSAVAMDKAILDMSEAKVAQASGGKAATAAKNLRREDLLALLRKLAYFVQNACDNNLPVLLGSGFEAASTNRAQSPLAKPVLTRIVPGMSGQTLVTASADPNARGYEIITAEVDESGAPGPFRPPVTRTSSRNIPVDGQIPGKLYAYQGRAIGGLNGFSDWSDVVVQRAA